MEPSISNEWPTGRRSRWAASLSGAAAEAAARPGDVAAGATRDCDASIDTAWALLASSHSRCRRSRRAVRRSYAFRDKSGCFATFAMILCASVTTKRAVCSSTDQGGGKRRGVSAFPVRCAVGPTGTEPTRKNRTRNNRPVLVLGGHGILCSHRRSGRRSTASALPRRARSGGR